MSIPACPTCGRELGPWEYSTCLSHLPALRDGTGFRRPPSQWAIADLAVAALESEAAPVAIHDVQRAVARDLGRDVYLPSLTALMGTDRRFCWSGRGVYGLFRHDRLPAVRTLSGLSRFVLAAFDAPMGLSDLSFVLKWSGYRFQDVSLEGALLRDAEEAGFRFAWPAPLCEREIRIVGARDVRRSIARELSVPDPDNGIWPAEELIERWRAKVAEGIDERTRRLSISAESMAAIDPDSPASLTVTDEMRAAALAEIDALRSADA